MNIQRLKDLREDKELLQKDIAKILKISQPQYSLYETGIRQIPAELIDKLAKFYDVDLNYIMGVSNKRNHYPKN